METNLTAECIVDVRVPANRISLDKKSVTITSISQKEKVEATIELIYSFSKAVYKSSNTNIAKVDSNGNITPVGIGTCKITAMTLDGTNLLAGCSITSNITYIRGDITRDGKVDMEDIYKMSKYIAGKITVL